MVRRVFTQEEALFPIINGKPILPERAPRTEEERLLAAAEALVDASVYCATDARQAVGLVDEPDTIAPDPEPIETPWEFRNRKARVLAALRATHPATGR